MINSRSYLSTCQKQGVDSTVALDLLFNGKWPDFIQIIIDAHIGILGMLNRYQISTCAYCKMLKAI